MSNGAPSEFDSAQGPYRDLIRGNPEEQIVSSSDYLSNAVDVVQHTGL